MLKVQKLTVYHQLHYLLFCGVRIVPSVFLYTSYNTLQMSVVVVPKFNFSVFLESLVRHRITHL